MCRPAACPRPSAGRTACVSKISRSSFFSSGGSTGQSTSTLRLQVALHGIGRGDEILLVSAVAEIVDAGVLQKSPDDADHADIFGQAGDPGTQPAGVAHDQVDLHPGHGGPVERLDDIAILQGVHLELDQASAVFACCVDLPFDLARAEPSSAAAGRGADLAGNLRLAMKPVVR